MNVIKKHLYFILVSTLFVAGGGGVIASASEIVGGVYTTAGMCGPNFCELPPDWFARGITKGNN